MARKRKARRRSKKQPISLLKSAAIAAPVIDSFQRAGGVAQMKSDPIKGITGFIDQLLQHFTGFSVFQELSGVNYWNTAYLVPTYGGILAGVAGSKLADRFGVNRELKRVPFLGKYIKL